MEHVVEHLPTWALFSLGVVWLSFQFVQKFLEWSTKRNEDRVRREYRKKRTEERLTNHSFDGKSVAPLASRPSEDTGRHDLRAILEEEREREQRLEILGNTRAHADLMRRLVEAETGQAALLKQLVEMQKSQSKTLDTVVETQKAIVRFLTTPGDARPAIPDATLREGFGGTDS